MTRHPSHDPDPRTGQCRACGMTQGEMLDFDIIECGDANAAEMLRPQLGNLAGLPGGMTGLEHHQRGLMIDGLLRRAERRKRAAEQTRDAESGGFAILCIEYWRVIAALMERIGGEIRISGDELANQGGQSTCYRLEDDGSTLVVWRSLKLPDGMRLVLADADHERALATQMRPRPEGWEGGARPSDDGARMEWRPPEGSRCRPLAFEKTGNPERDGRLAQALFNSAWQSLEHERITGEPPL